MIHDSYQFPIKSPPKQPSGVEIAAAPEITAIQIIQPEGEEIEKRKGKKITKGCTWPDRASKHVEAQRDPAAGSALRTRKIRQRRQAGI